MFMVWNYDKDALFKHNVCYETYATVLNFYNPRRFGNQKTFSLVNSDTCKYIPTNNVIF